MFEISEETKALFEDFFEKEEYKKQILSDSSSITININDLKKFEPNLASDLVNRPEWIIGIIKEVINGKDIIITGLKECIPLRDLSSTHIAKLIKIRGIVNKVSDIRPMYVMARFRCRECGEITPPEPQENPLVLSQPIRCNAGADDEGKGGCKGRSFDVIPEMSEFIDSQEIRVQELLEDIPSGQTPKNRKVVIFTRDLINKVKCGDIVEVVGILKVITITKGFTKTRYTIPYLEAYNIILKSKDPESIEISKEEEKKILELASDPQVYLRLISSIAPNIYGHDDIKEACLYLLFGGESKKKGNIRIRGDIHVLLVGDPAVAKSQILRSVANISPRGLYTSGRGATGVGLTAAVVKEKDGSPALEAGALVLADKGVCCIDEIDKMKPEDRVSIHGAMEQQVVPINKWGLNTEVNTRTAILAAGNPAMGRWDKYKTVAENMSNLPVTLFSRFDLIFIMKDVPQKDVDVRMSEHMLGIYQDIPEIIPVNLFRKYIAFAKRIKIRLSKEAKQCLKDFFVEMRQKSNGEVTITARQLEALVRLTEAHARIGLRSEASLEDAKAAIRLFKVFLEQVGIDPTTGKQDIDAIETGKTKTKKEQMKIVMKIIDDLDYENNGKGALRSEVIRQAKAIGITTKLISEVINKFTHEYDVGYIKLSQRQLM